MNILCSTSGEVSTASSRLRSFFLFDGCPIITSERGNWNIHRLIKCEIVHVQKKINFKIIFYMAIARILRKVVVYDIDDQLQSTKHWNSVVIRPFINIAFFCAVTLSTFLTVDTLERKKSLKRRYNWKSIVIVPDIMETALNLHAKKIKENQFIWFGNSVNLSSIYQFMREVKNNDLVKLDIYTDLEKLDLSSIDYSNITFHQWSQNFLLDDEHAGKFLILNHTGEAGQYKSDNKLISGFLAGMIPVVSDTPAYNSILQKINFTQFIFDNEVSLLSQISTISTRDALEYSLSGNKFANKFRCEKRIRKLFFRYLTKCRS
jgi:hypothetical protein